MTKRSADEARMAAIFGSRRRHRAAPAPQKPDRPQARTTHGSLTDGTMCWLDRDAERAWERTLGRADQARWDEIKALLSAAGPEIRWRAAGWVMRAELEHAQKCYRVAKNLDDKPYKADMIRQNGAAFREAVDRLESRLADVYRFLLPLGSLIGDVEAAHVAVNHWRTTLHRVTAPWASSWPGVDRGKGLPGYDTPEGVQRLRDSVREAHERYQQRQAEKSTKAKGKRSRSR